MTAAFASRPELDRIDRRILRELMRDATLPIIQLAERVGLSQAPRWKPVQKLEASGIITGRVAIVDPEASGLGLTVFVEIEAADHTPKWRATFAPIVADHPPMQEAARRAGEVDFLLKVVVSGMEAYDAFYRDLTQRLPGRNVTSQFPIERIKAITSLPIDTGPA